MVVVEIVVVFVVGIVEVIGIEFNGFLVVGIFVVVVVVVVSGAHTTFKQPIVCPVKI